MFAVFVSIAPKPACTHFFELHTVAYRPKLIQINSQLFKLYSSPNFFGGDNHKTMFCLIRKTRRKVGPFLTFCEFVLFTYNVLD